MRRIEKVANREEIGPLRTNSGKRRCDPNNRHILSTLRARLPDETIRRTRPEFLGRFASKTGDKKRELG